MIEHVGYLIKQPLMNSIQSQNHYIIVIKKFWSE